MEEHFPGDLKTLACGSEDVEGLIRTFSNRKIDPPSDEPPSADPIGEDFKKNYPNLSKFLSLLEIASVSIDIFLRPKDSKDAKSNPLDLIGNLKWGILREIWTNKALSSSLRHLSKRFLDFTRVLQEPLSNEAIKLVLLLLQFILKAMIHEIKTAPPARLQQYEKLFTTFKNILVKIAKSGPVKAVLASIASGTFTVAGASFLIGALGFTTEGILAGSLAASWMAASGPIASGSLFAALQSAGVIGLGSLATGGLFLGGAVVGLGSYGLYRLVTRERNYFVKVYPKKDGVIGTDATIVRFTDKTTLKQLLEQYIPVDTPIPVDATEVGLCLYDPKGKESSIPVVSLDNKARKVIKSNSLVMFRSVPGNTNPRHPFFLRKQNQDTWMVEVNRKGWI